MTAAAVADLGIAPRVPVWLAAKATDAMAYPAPHAAPHAASHAEPQVVPSEQTGAEIGTKPENIG